MHFHMHTVRAGCKRSAGHGRNQVWAPCCVAGVGNDRQMTLALNIWNGRQVDHVPCAVFKCSYSTLAQNHIQVPLAQHILG